MIRNKERETKSHTNELCKNAVKKLFVDLPIREGGTERVSNTEEVAREIGKTHGCYSYDLSKIAYRDRACLLAQFENIVYTSGSSWHNMFFSRHNSHNICVVNPSIIDSQEEIAFHQLYILMMSDLDDRFSLHIPYRKREGIVPSMKTCDPNESWRNSYEIQMGALKGMLV